MKKIKVSIALLLILVTFSQLFGCAVKIPAQDEVTSTDEAEALGLSIADDDGTLMVGEYAWIDINIKIDYRYALKWTSSNPEVATVDDNGRVDALSPGKTTITAKVEKSSVSYQLTVKEDKPAPVTSSTANVDNRNKLIVDQNKNNPKGLNLYSLHINAETGCLTVYTYNSDDYYYLPVRSMVCSVAKDGTLYEADDPRETIFYQTKDKNEWVQESDDKFYQYSTTFVYGDTEFAITSCAYSEESASTLITADYNKLGTAYTEGNIRLSADDAKWIYDNCEEGTQIKIVTEAGKDQLKRPDPVRLSENAKYPNWDPTDPDKNNPYFKEVPTFTGVDDLYIARGSVCDLYKGVEVYDTCMNPCGSEFKVDSKVFSEKTGKYLVTYHYTDALGHYGRADRTVYVTG